MAEDAGEEGVLAVTDESALAEAFEALESNALGFWDGSCFYLRSFPVWYRWWQVPNSEYSTGRPESGRVGGVDFEQSMGRITCWYRLEDQYAALREEDFCVEMSSWELKVTVGQDVPQGKGAKVEPLCGELFHDIRRNLSWWDVTQDEMGEKWLVIHLTKVLHKAWKTLWYPDPLNPHRKMMFGWTWYHGKPEKDEDEKLSRCLPGQPQDIDKALCSGMTAERLCTGVEGLEDEWFVFVHIHLDEAAVEAATDRVPLEELFAANIRQDSIQVFLRNDGFGVCAARLKGYVAAEYSAWEFSNVRRYNLPKGSLIKCPAFYNPVLRIKIPKADGCQGLWGGVFEELQTPEFAPPRERMSWTERVQRALVLSPGAPLKLQVKTMRAHKMCTRIETSQDTVTQRAILTLHLDEALEENAFKYKVDLSTFFALKVADRMVEVSVVADAEFTMCVGSLGGAVEPSRTNWEISRAKNSPSDEKEHLILKISLVKAAGSKERWPEVFTKMEPWQVSASLHPALADDSAVAEGDGKADEAQAGEQE